MLFVEWIKNINDVIKRLFADTDWYFSTVQSTKIQKPPPLFERNIKKPSLGMFPTSTKKILEELSPISPINDVRYSPAPLLKQKDVKDDEHFYDVVNTTCKPSVPLRSSVSLRQADVDETRNQLEKNLNISHYPQNKDTINESPLFGSSSAEGSLYEEEDESDNDDDTYDDYSWCYLVDNHSVYEDMSQSNTNSQADMGNQQEDLVMYEQMQSVEAIQKQENQDSIYNIPNPSIYEVPNNLPVKSSRILNRNNKALTLPVIPSEKSFLEMKSSTLPLIKNPPPVPPPRATSMAQPMKEQVVSDNELLPISAYYKDMEKHEGSKILRELGVLGTYIIRSRIEGGVQKDSLSVLVNRTTGETKHYRIFRKNNIFYLCNDHPAFTTLLNLIRHYYTNSLPNCDVSLSQPFS